MKERKPIPSEIKQSLLIQCGYKCSVPRCNTTEALEFHHINKKPNDNRKENIIVFCAVHHHQADTGKISAKACKVIKKTLPRIEDTSKKWKPIPKIEFNLQILPRILPFPRVGWEAYNDSPYQLKVRIEVHPILGGKDLHPLADNDINGTNPYDAAPNDWLFRNGCFTLPSECAKNEEKELILEIRAFVLDVNDIEKGEYTVSPSRWKYVRELNAWSYYPQQPNVLKK